VVVPESGGARLDLQATVSEVDGDVVTVALSATCDGKEVVKDATATVRVA
jgi:hypothetical protein